MKAFGLILTVILLWTSQRQGQSADAEKFGKANGLLVVKKGFLSTNSPAVVSFAKNMGAVTIMESEQNPVCCVAVWPLAVDSNLTGDQYAMISYGFTLIQVTGEKGLEKLNAQLKEMRCPTNMLPMGIMSSFKNAAESPRPEEKDGKRSH